MRVRIARVRASGTRAGGWVRGVWAVCTSQVGECAGVWVCLQCGRPVLEAVCTCNEELSNLLGAFQAPILTPSTYVKLI